MRYISTRDEQHQVSPAEALGRGLAPGGGLYVPKSFPDLSIETLLGLTDPIALTTALLGPFLAPDLDAAQLERIVRRALHFPLPLTDHEGRARVLELYHGPTAAFKDVGAGFLSAAFSELGQTGRTIVVATSGDTGGAVAQAFADYPDERVVILYPRGMVSARQEQQLTCWPDHITSIRVSGSFDDCQRLAKQALNDAELVDQLRLTSANSISIGRLLPQMSYYAVSSLAGYREHGASSHYIIPTGNLGNALAAIWLRSLGFPIGQIVLATNANRTIPDYLEDGIWSPGETVATLASAMDVGNPSNMERLNHLLPDLQHLRDSVTAHAVEDRDIEARIRQDYQCHGRFWCPHSASAAVVHDRIRTDPAEHWILVATAHAAKFNDIVEPLINAPVPVPESLAAILARPSRAVDMPPQWSAFRSILARLRRSD